MRPINPEAMGRWLFAGACSLGLHVVVLLLLLWLGSSGAARPPDPLDETATVATDSSNPVPETATPPPAGDDKVAVETPSRRPGPTATSSRGTPSRARPPAARSSASDAATAASTPAPSGTPRVKSYRVKRGDKLLHIARDCGSTPAELAKLNGVDEKTLADLKVGQVIKITVKE